VWRVRHCCMHVFSAQYRRLGEVVPRSAPVRLCECKQNNPFCCKHTPSAAMHGFRLCSAAVHCPHKLPVPAPQAGPQRCALHEPLAARRQMQAGRLHTMEVGRPLPVAWMVHITPLPLVSLPLPLPPCHAAGGGDMAAAAATAAPRRAVSLRQCGMTGPGCPTESPSPCHVAVSPHAVPGRGAASGS